MEGYYGLKEGTVFVYFPYYFTGMSLDGLSFRFRFDFPFLDRLAKSRLNLEDLTERGWKIEKFNIRSCFLEVLINSFRSNSKEKTEEMAYEIIEMVEQISENNSRKNYGYDCSSYKSSEDLIQDKWWDLGLEAPFLQEDFDWKEDDCED